MAISGADGYPQLGGVSDAGCDVLGLWALRTLRLLYRQSSIDATRVVVVCGLRVLIGQYSCGLIIGPGPFSARESQCGAVGHTPGSRIHGS